MASKRKNTSSKKLQGNDPVRLKVLDIYLDALNPRHAPIDHQPDIISHLVKKEKVRNLARDIAQEGISPIELFAVVRD
jgi:hypothetical protein